MRLRASHTFGSLIPWALSGLAIASLCVATASCLLDQDQTEQDELPATPAAVSDFLSIPGGVDEAGSDEEARPGDEPEDTDELGSLLGTFRLTYYWIAAATDRGEPDTVLVDLSCEPIAEVSASFASRLQMEGTGKLPDGRIVNVAGACDCDSPCYFIPGPKKRWGVGVAKRPLSPFRSVAVDPEHVSIGQMLYIPELDGLTMPGHQPWGGFVHDGCVIADDRGGNIEGQQLDFFTGRRHAYNALFRRHRISTVTVYDGTGRCAPDERGKVVAASRNSI